MTQMMGMMQTCSTMMQRMAESPAIALRYRDSLGLSTARVQKLGHLRSRFDQARSQAMVRMQALHRQIASVTGAGAGYRGHGAAPRSSAGERPC